jgi:hypothetical protein
MPSRRSSRVVGGFCVEIPSDPRSSRFTDSHPVRGVTDSSWCRMGTRISVRIAIVLHYHRDLPGYGPGSVGGESGLSERSSCKRSFCGGTPEVFNSLSRVWTPRTVTAKKSDQETEQLKANLSHSFWFLICTFINSQEWNTLTFLWQETGIATCL